MKTCDPLLLFSLPPSLPFFCTVGAGVRMREVHCTAPSPSLSLENEMVQIVKRRKLMPSLKANSLWHPDALNMTRSRFVGQIRT